jgi:protease-4
LFKYKSAVEVLSREQMSDADREQRQALIDGFYEVVRGDICASRKFAPADFDKLINEQVFYMPKQAVAAGLVDTLARWNALEEILKKTTGGKKYLIEAGDLAQVKALRPVWGPRPRIAVVYGLGACEMESGINAVKLEQIFKKLTEDAQIKAVVFRVDSPGGAILPSDIVAEALKKCAAKKPVIVSQGQVAGSGGYWISMNADTIVAAPQTITGSIGVIGGWLWNERLGAKLGLTSDFVKVGDHADLTFGITLPLLGMQIPDRNLTPEERTKIVAVIQEWYQEFKTKVAQGRQLTAEAVEDVAQGRVWTGKAGKEKGLVDELGGLEIAIHLARKAAHLPDKEDIALVEYPKPGLFNPEIFMPKLLGVKVKLPTADQELEFLKIIARNPGQPVILLSPDFYIQK